MLYKIGEQRENISSNFSKKISSPSLSSSSFTDYKKHAPAISYLKTKICHRSDDVYLSDHDRRILAAMVLKKKLQQEDDEFAHQARILWEKNREIREHLKYDHNNKWKKYIAERRRMENTEKDKKSEEVNHSSQKSLERLRRGIDEKEELVARRKKFIDNEKVVAAEERFLESARRRAEVETAQQLMSIETALWQHTVSEQQRERLERAENVRLQWKENHQNRVASMNRAEELLHQECWLHVKEESDAALQKLYRLCHQREQKAHKRYQEALLKRDHHIKSQSLERAIKFRQVRDLHDELEHGLKMWQEQVMRLQWAAMKRAEQNVLRNVEGKKHHLEMANKTRTQRHSRLMDRVLQEDEARIKYIRELIKQKEIKMKQSAKERNLAIRESQQQARTAANLREYLRCSLFPETFDRKVVRVILEMRIGARPSTANTRMTKSHIYLG